MRFVRYALLPLALLAGCGSPETGIEPAAEQNTALESARPIATAIAQRLPLASPNANGEGISYQGGPVMLGTTNLYYIWYGSWKNNSATSILTDFAQNIGRSPYYEINTTYSDSSGARVQNDTHFGGSTTDAYSKGTALSDADIKTIVKSAIDGGRLPLDANGVYFVLTSADVSQTSSSTSSFCANYCGWHNFGTIDGTTVKYSFIGNGDACPLSCQSALIRSPNTSPNGNAGADGMASTIAHELDEAVTDPELSAWVNPGTQENGDLCAWSFGATYSSANSGSANMHLGSRDYLVQRNFVNAGAGKCSLTLSLTNPSADVGSSVAGDFNGDGKGDVLWRDIATGDVNMWLMNGASLAQNLSIWKGIPTEWQPIGTGDLNGDFNSDIVWRNLRTGTIVAWMVRGNTILQNVELWRNIPSKWQAQGIADFNGDGKADILWRDWATGDVNMWLMNGGAVAQNLSIWKAIPFAWETLAVGDFGGDGKADILWRNADSGEVHLWSMNAGEVVANEAVATVSSDSELQTTGDFDGDRKADLVWRSISDHGLTLWEMNGATVRTIRTLPAIASELQVQGASDFDGDTKADLLFRDARTGDVVMSLMDGATARSTTTVWGNVPSNWQIVRN